MKFIKNALTMLAIVTSLSTFAGDGDAGSGGGPRMVAGAKLADGRLEIPSSLVLSANTREGVLNPQELIERKFIKDGLLSISNESDFFLDVEMKNEVLLDMEMVRNVLEGTGGTGGGPNSGN